MHNVQFVHVCTIVPSYATVAWKYNIPYITWSPDQSPDSPHAEQLTFSHGLINYKETKTKCRHLKK